MFQAIRRHLNPATIMAFVALVFAVTGGAFAATGGSRGGGGSSPAKASASTGRTATFTAVAAKKKAKTKASARGPAGPKGATGATGPAGPAGPAGSAGATGPAGSGSQGPQGIQGEKGATGATGPAGATGETGPEGVCSQAHCVLPAETTETGTWTASGRIALGSISFTIPLAKALEGSGCGEPEPRAKPCQVHYVSQNGKEQAFFNLTTFVWSAEPTSDCPGTAAAPAAAPGNLCVYQVEAVGAETISSSLAKAAIGGATPRGYGYGLVPKAGVSGAFVEVQKEEPEVIVWGSWAVTAE